VLVPFGTCTWQQGFPVPRFGDKDDPARPRLEHCGGIDFVLLNSLAYCVPDQDPDEGTIYIVPGKDAPKVDERRPETPDGTPVVLGILNGTTDLASVPWFMWWLVASYGNHTMAALLHDALIVGPNEPQPVPRTTADRLFLRALREDPKKTGAIRHWFMWAAVSAFGTLRNRLLFTMNALGVWVALLVSVLIMWGPLIWSGSVGGKLVRIAFALFLVVCFAFLLGLVWRAGVYRLPVGWVLPVLALAALILVPIFIEWSAEGLDTWPAWLLIGSLALFVLGLAWRGVDPLLRGWLWPTTLIGLPVAAIPLGLIFLSVLLVWFVDVGAVTARDRSKVRDHLPDVIPSPRS
jgi:hypothetical protein